MSSSPATPRAAHRVTAAQRRSSSSGQARDLDPAREQRRQAGRAAAARWPTRCAAGPGPAAGRSPARQRPALRRCLRTFAERTSARSSGSTKRALAVEHQIAHRVDDPRPVLTSQPVQRDVDELLRRQRPGPAPVPTERPRPVLGAGTRPGRRRPARAVAQARRVQPHLGVGQVVVVDQQEVAPPERPPAQARPQPRRARPPRPGASRTSRRSPCSSAHRYTPIAIRCGRSTWETPAGRVAGSCSIHTGRSGRAHPRSTCACRVVTPGSCNHTWAHGGQVPTAGRLELDEEVRERGVSPRMGGEVAVHPDQEGLMADVGDQLLDHRRALRVGDPVEVQVHSPRVRRCRPRPGASTAAGPERRPTPSAPGRTPSSLREPGRVGRRAEARPLREGLVEPQVVPPPHRDQVSEPHVRHLVQDDHGPRLASGIGHPGPEDGRLLAEGHQAGVLHRTEVELRDRHLVVLAERVGHIERALVVRQPRPGDLQDLVGVEVLGHRRPHEDPQRVGPVRPLVLRRDDCEGPAHRTRRGRSTAAGVEGNVHRASPVADLHRIRRGGSWTRTSQPAGRSAASRRRAFRSGCSKQANTRRASAVANWVYR